MLRLVLTFAAALISGCASASSMHPPPQKCAVEQGRAFDFWLGEWEIEQQIRAADGSWIVLPARTSVSGSPDGCVLTEHWSGEVQFFWEGMNAPEALMGYSVRAYDPRTTQWAIYWLDSRNRSFGAPYVGGFENGRGEFRRTLETPEGPRLGRIVFSGITASSANWELAVSADNGATWTTLWMMAMRR